MNQGEYDKLLDWLQENRGGIGDKRVQNIKNEFSNGDDFVKACKNAYDNREFDELTQIDGIGRGYAHSKLALALAEYYDWSGGDAEPIDLTPTRASNMI